MIKKVALESGCRSLSLLEVAAGSGEMAKAIQRRLQADGIGLQVSMLDRAWSHLRRGTNGNGTSSNGLSRGRRGSASTSLSGRQF